MDKELKRFTFHCLDIMMENGLPRQNRGQFLSWARRFFSDDEIKRWEKKSQWAFVKIQNK